ncbi:MAG: imidazole glycerol phosphate synthase subunit HisH [Enterobacterales bacterium]|nr:imidazole glycerol phosphate synthase subunit HisH [Enterobacterales bacterium]
MTKKLLIIDTLAGNLFSLQAAAQRLGFEVDICQSPNDIIYDALVIPGQGRFASVVNQLKKQGWDSYLKNAHEHGLPMLGICVGMQIFFEASDEDPEVTGFAWFKGKAKALDFPKKPMVGWAELDSRDSIFAGKIVYFVNSFAVDQADESVATTEYGQNFCAAVKRGAFYGVQFHPEKSSQAGLQMMANILLPENQGELKSEENNHV